MDKIAILFIIGAVFAVAIISLLNRICDNTGEIDLDRERELTEGFDHE